MLPKTLPPVKSSEMYARTTKASPYGAMPEIEELVWRDATISTYFVDDTEEAFSIPFTPSTDFVLMAAIFMLVPHPMTKKVSSYRLEEAVKKS